LPAEIHVRPAVSKQLKSPSMALMRSNLMGPLN